MAESPFNMVALHDDEEGEEIDHYAHLRTPTYGMPVFQASGAVPGRTYTRIHAPTARARAYTRAYTRARTRAHTRKKEDPVNQRMISLHRSPGEAVRISDLESDAGRRYNGLRAVVVGDLDRHTLHIIDKLNGKTGRPRRSRPNSAPIKQVNVLGPASGMIRPLSAGVKRAKVGRQQMLFTNQDTSTSFSDR